MDSIVLFTVIALCLLAVAVVGLLVLYIRAELKLAKYNKSVFFDKTESKDNNADNGEL